jgi:hypothetical protein
MWQVFVQVRLAEGCLRHRHRRFQQPLIADASGPTVSRELLVVNLEHLLGG